MVWYFHTIVNRCGSLVGYHHPGPRRLDLTNHEWAVVRQGRRPSYVRSARTSRSMPETTFSSWIPVELLLPADTAMVWG